MAHDKCIIIIIIIIIIVVVPAIYVVKVYECHPLDTGSNIGVQGRQPDVDQQPLLQWCCHKHGNHEAARVNFAHQVKKSKQRYMKFFCFST